MMIDLTPEDIDTIEDWWVKKSRVNFLAYRQFMHSRNFKKNWFIADLCKQLQDFYIDLKAGKRPILLLQTPPQHGKSFSISDFIAWIMGKIESLRVIYASYSDTLGIRCNTFLQRSFDSGKYKKIFPDFNIAPTSGNTLSNKARRNSKLIETWEGDEPDDLTESGYFRNTTVAGPITGESLDVGVIDDAVKGREQANSITWSEKVWEWFTDDFLTRFSETAGMIIITTRWTTHDIIARIKSSSIENIKSKNYQAIATKNEEKREEGEALFPQLKSLEFLKGKKAIMADSSWESLYQGNPTISGGNVIKDDWWMWWKVLPKLTYKFITVDTAQKDKVKNDWTVFQCWGYGVDGRIYLLDKVREKMLAPVLRKEAEIFYKKHDTRRINRDEPILRKMYIEDKSSGIGLIQELRRKRLKVEEVPRSTDKYLRAEDCAPYIETGLVVLNVDVPGVGNLTKEAREFPNGEFDDDFDTCMTAIEVSFIGKQQELFVA